MATHERKNGLTPSEEASYVEGYEELEKKVATLRSNFMTACKRVREDQKEMLDEAKSRGGDKRAIRATVEFRLLTKKRAAKLDNLEDDTRKRATDMLKTLGEALGDFVDLPLGAAAVAAAGQDPTTAAVVAAVRGNMTDEEWEAAGKQ